MQTEFFGQRNITQTRGSVRQFFEDGEGAINDAHMVVPLFVASPSSAVGRINSLLSSAA
jgi:hypothetical protein